MAKGITTIGNLKQLSERIRNGDLSPLELVERCIEKIKQYDGQLNSFITILEDSARAEARSAETQIKEGRYHSPLHGIPFSIKDVIYAKDVRCTAGSKIMSDYVSNVDSTSVAKIRRAGAILVGTNNTHEFACGITNVNPHYGSSRNPWDTSRLSGGSSGGSAVAVAAGMVPVALGTDTSGSIRVPSALCGAVGLKPTYGRVSKFGIVDLAPSLDHVGTITRSVWDAAAALQVIAGQDPLDPVTQDVPVPNYVECVERAILKKFTIGIPKEYFFDYLQPEVQRVFFGCVDNMKSNGMKVVEIHLKETEKIYESWRPIRLGESANIHSDWLNTRASDYGDDVRNMLTRGTQVSAIEYIRAHKFRSELRQEFSTVLKEVDAVAMPTTPLTAPTFEEKTVELGTKTFEIYQALSRQTIAFDSTGLPAITIPAGLTKDTLPVGAQLVGRPFEEETILSIAYVFEAAGGGKLLTDQLPYQ
jgi:aspartyl-tRNA(Asn)/glutamyl-tRNA(Gln) amidotransferase subunit A